MANAFKTACFINKESESFPSSNLDTFITSISTATTYTNSTVSSVIRFPYAPYVTTMSFPNCNFLEQQAFVACSTLSYIYLMSTSVCSMGYNANYGINGTPFYGTSISSTAGYIYVPTSLVATYKATVGWSYFSNRIYGV